MWPFKKKHECNEEIWQNQTLYRFRKTGIKNVFHTGIFENTVQYDGWWEKMTGIQSFCMECGKEIVFMYEKIEHVTDPSEIMELEARGQWLFIKPTSIKYVHNAMGTDKALEMLNRINGEKYTLTKKAA